MLFFSTYCLSIVGRSVVYFFIYTKNFTLVRCTHCLCDKRSHTHSQTHTLNQHQALDFPPVLGLRVHNNHAADLHDNHRQPAGRGCSTSGDLILAPSNTDTETVFLSSALQTVLDAKESQRFCSLINRRTFLSSLHFHTRARKKMLPAHTAFLRRPTILADGTNVDE